NKTKSFLTINITIDKAHALIEFIDNGVGIGKQHQDDIFNMFYKASHLSKGAGLGLYIVKETLEKLGGTISLESEIGFGTAFRVSIPNDHKGKLIGQKLQLKKRSE
ncbi:MAG TPA: ATP-binding protein, partial [Cyclobacteriaceae bacterium]|nr:ATP-binding protein [Cyclobacteriaceae bacterium]